MNGFLKKQGKVTLGFWDWRDRWFKQVDNKLFYYKSKTDVNYQGFIDLSQVTDAKVRGAVLFFCCGSPAPSLVPITLGLQTCLDLRFTSRTEFTTWLPAVRPKCLPGSTLFVTRDLAKHKTYPFISGGKANQS